MALSQQNANVSHPTTNRGSSSIRILTALGIVVQVGRDGDPDVPLAADGVVLQDETGEGPALAHAGTVTDEESLAISDGGLVGVGGRGIALGGGGGGGGSGGGGTSTNLLLGLDGGHLLVGRGRGILQGCLLLVLLGIVGRGLERAAGIGGRQVLLMALASVDDGLELEGGQLALLDDVGGHGEVVCMQHMWLDWVGFEIYDCVRNI